MKKKKKLKEIERRAMGVNNCGCVGIIVDCVSAAGVNNCDCVSAAGVNNCDCVSDIVDCVSVVGIGKCFLHGT